MNKANVFMGASWIGLLGVALTALAALSILPEGALTPATLLTVAASLALLATRKADEYTLGLWTAGASFAFGVMVVMFLGLPFAEGVYDGIRGAERKRDIGGEVVSIVAIAAFYFGLFLKRMLGDIA